MQFSQLVVISIKLYHSSLDELKKQQLLDGDNEYDSYTVQYGDSIAKIAYKF
jgi:hypothetical protein